MRTFRDWSVAFCVLALMAPPVAATAAHGSFASAGPVHVEGVAEAALRPLALIANDTSEIRALEAAYASARVCLHEYTFFEIPIADGEPLRAQGPWSDDCHERTDVRLALDGLENAGWFGIFPDEDALVVLAAETLSAVPNAVSRLASDDVKTATTSDLDDPERPAYAKTIRGPHLIITEPGAGTYTGLGLVKVKGPDVRITSTEGAATYATGENVEPTPTGVRRVVMRWVSITPHERGTLAWDSPVPTILAAADAPRVTFDGAMHATPTTGTVRAGLREYRAAGQPATFEGAFSAVFVPTLDGGGIGVDLSGDLRSTSLAPVPAPLIPDAQASSWLTLVLFAAAAAVTVGSGALLWRTRRKDTRSEVTALIHLGKRALESAESPDGTTDFTPAIAHFKRATELAPNLADAWMGLGYALERADNHREALKAFTRAYAEGGGHDALLMIAICLAAEGEGASASDWLAKALRAPEPSMDVLAAIRSYPRLRALLDDDPDLKAAFAAATDRALEGFGGHQP